MTEREDESYRPFKKFKSRHEKNDETCCGGHKEDGEAGSYFLGPVIKKYARAPVTQCLARKKRTDDYYLMKILVLDDSDTSDKCSFARRTLFHNEYSILSLLRNQPGVVQLHDFFKDSVYEESQDKKLKRVCMVLECLIPHGHHNLELIPLSQYLKEGRLSETEALYIFYNLLLVIQELHNKNIVHRDLKLPSIILNRRTLKVKLTDFYYAKFLMSDTEVQYSQCTSSYSSPDVLAGQPVLPKTCDMWSAGVILYAMLNGCMPFPSAANYGSSLSSNRCLRDLYLRIMENDCTISNNTCISDGTKNVLRNILWKIPQFRLKASEAVDMVSTLLALQSSSQNPSLFTESKFSDQVVPECPDFDSKDQQESTISKIVHPPSEPPTESEPDREERNSKQKTEKPTKGSEASSELSTASSKLSTQQNGVLSRKQIKYAMLRLGVTSVNNINALSFSYTKKNACRS